LDSLIVLGILVVGTILLAVIAVKSLARFLKSGFWVLTLPFKILIGTVGALFSILFTLLIPVFVILGVVGLVVTPPILLIFAVPCVLIGLAICLVMTSFS
tara:strand:+ start:112 stop:411 length:300 start_codon:yes stop_codon:yes gene_type:complete